MKPDEKNFIPVWSGNFAPFLLVSFEEEVWNPTIEDINLRSYDRTKLFRSTLNVRAGIDPLSLIVLFDSTLILPCAKHISQSTALEIFNMHLTQLSLGGLHVEEVAPDDVNFGLLNFDGYHQFHGTSGRYSKRAQDLRTLRAGPDETILLFEPKVISETDYRKIHWSGERISNLLPSGFFAVYLPACTSFCNEMWERALILAWTAVEILMELVWKRHILSTKKVGGLQGKRNRFLNDSRAWTSSIRIELLWQRDLISEDLYAILDSARRARNNFVHSAASGNAADAKGAVTAMLEMIEFVVIDNGLSFNAAQKLEQLMRATPKFRKPISDAAEKTELTPRFYRKLEPAPGFIGWGDANYEKHDKIKLVPIDEIDA